MKKTIFIVSTITLVSIFSVVVYFNSQQNGRLASVPFYDECTYFYSSASIVDSITKNGFSDTILNFSNLPLHSPYCVVLSSIILFFSDYNTEYIYYSGIIVILLCVGMLLYAIRTESYVIKFLLVACSLLWPVCTIAACEFRPDSLWGISLALIAVQLIAPKDGIFTFRRGVFLGICLASALLVKPTAFPLTIIIFLSSFTLRLFYEKLFINTKLFASAFVYLMSSLSVCIITVLPYVYFHGLKIWTYFYDNVFGASAGMWEPSTNLSDKFLYYILGSGAGSAFSLGSYLMVCVSFLSTLYIFKFGTKSVKIRVFFLFSILFVSYFVISTGNIKSVFLGSPFYFILLSLSVFSLSEFCNITRLIYPIRGFTFCSITLIFVFAFGIFHFKWPEICFVHPSLAKFRAQAHHALASSIEQPNDNRIYFLRHGPIPPENIGLFLIKNGYTPFLSDSGRNPPKNVQEFLAQSSSANLIVIADDNIVGHQTMIPIGNLYHEIDAYLRNSEAFQLVNEISDYSGKKMSIFRRL